MLSISKMLAIVLLSLVCMARRVHFTGLCRVIELYGVCCLAEKTSSLKVVGGVGVASLEGEKA